MKLLFFTFTFIFSVSALGNSDWWSAQRTSGNVSTPVAANNSQRTRTGNARYDSIINSLDQYNDPNTPVGCNRSYENAARALICNCANEAGNQSLAGMTSVSRVVFSRAKSTAYPNSVREVICQRSQFSWTIGGWDGGCNRTGGNPTYFNTPDVDQPMLSKCVTSAKEAARLELVENPSELYALNYCSTNPAAYRNAIPRWCQTLINTRQHVVGDHAFGFANSGQRNSIPAPGQATSISFFKLFKKAALFVESAYASGVNETKIINTRADKKIYYNDKIKQILKRKYQNFKPYSFKDYKKSVKNLMVGTRNNLPGSAIGDYNGDGKKDLVLMGSRKNKHVIIAFLSKGRGYKDYVVSSEAPYKKPLDNYLVNIRKSKIKFDDKKERDAFQIESFGGAAIAKYFDGRRFVDNGAKGGFKYL